MAEMNIVRSQPRVGGGCSRRPGRRGDVVVVGGLEGWRSRRKGTETDGGAADKRVKPGVRMKLRCEKERWKECMGMSLIDSRYITAG